MENLVDILRDLIVTLVAAFFVMVLGGGLLVWRTVAVLRVSAGAFKAIIAEFKKDTKEIIGEIKQSGVDTSDKVNSHASKIVRLEGEQKAVNQRLNRQDERLDRHSKIINKH